MQSSHYLEENGQKVGDFYVSNCGKYVLNILGYYTDELSYDTKKYIVGKDVEIFYKLPPNWSTNEIAYG